MDNLFSTHRFNVKYMYRQMNRSDGEKTQCLPQYGRGWGIITKKTIVTWMSRCPFSILPQAHSSFKETNKKSRPWVSKQPDATLSCQTWTRTFGHTQCIVCSIMAQSTKVDRHETILLTQQEHTCSGELNNQIQYNHACPAKDLWQLAAA